jgi:hypothetical protein
MIFDMLQESLYHGVPLLCLPLSLDQNINRQTPQNPESKNRGGEIMI